MSATLTGEARLLELADRMRRLGEGTVQPHRLYHECVDAFRRGEITFDQVTPLYRHSMLHAGAIVRKGGIPFRVCPTCEADLTGSVSRERGE